MGVHAGGQRMYKIISGLAEKHEISVLTFMERNEEQSHVDELKSICKSVTAIQRKPNYDAPDLFHIKPHRFVHEFAHPEMKRVLEEEVRSGKYDIVQFEYLEMAYLASGIRQFRVPMILTDHEVQSRNILQSVRANSMPFIEKMQTYFNWMIVTNFELRVARMFDTVVMLTDAERSALAQFEPSLHAVVHNTGVDVRYFSSVDGPETEKHSMVFVGYYRHFPNADAMLYFSSSILPLIKAKVPDAKLYIVGAEPTQSILKLHDGKSVIVTGKVDDIRPHVAKAAVYIVPMRLGAGIRGKILEAWSMKKAVVSTQIAASGLHIEQGENIVIADEPQEFADSVIDLFNNEKKRKLLGENALKTAADEYDWPAQVKKHEEIYYDTLKREG
jgi:glycosyltransferase involved in cell wall biosynthesis